MIDWHSHILPCMDDGSQSVEESIEMLDIQAREGADTVIATPHFYADDESAKDFLQRRDEAYRMLLPHLTGSHPAVVLGAEVRYYKGISRLKELKLLRIGQSKLLLLEMPCTKWSDYTLCELMELSGNGGTRIVLAHAERYLFLQSKPAQRQILDGNFLIQVNSSCLTDFGKRHKAISGLKKGNIHFIGSDCHGTEHRPPRLKKAFEIIEKRFGAEFIGQMDIFGRSMLYEKAKVNPL